MFLAVFLICQCILLRNSCWKNYKPLTVLIYINDDHQLSFWIEIMYNPQTLNYISFMKFVRTIFKNDDTDTNNNVICKDRLSLMVSYTDWFYMTIL